MHITRTISLPKELDERVEEARGLIPRSAFAQAALETYLQQQTGNTTSTVGVVRTSRPDTMPKDPPADFAIPEKQPRKPKPPATPGLGRPERKAKSKSYELPKIAPRKKG